MTVSIARRRIVIDDVPHQLIAGEIHYFRTPREQWQQRIALAAEAGCTVIASYLPWLLHELPDGSIDVRGDTRPERDVGAFIDLCAEAGLQFIARPGPYIMAELKNEGLPYRVLREHPEIVGTGWDSAAVVSAAVDYLHPAFLAEAERWYSAIMPVIAERLHSRGGPVIGVQLDNEIGMLQWVSNTPSLTEELLTDLLRWCRDRHGDAFDAIYPEPTDPAAWRAAVASPQEQWAGELRLDLALFMRGRFARYTRALQGMAAEHGVCGVPLLINIHGTEGGNGVPFGIGVSQLLDTFAGVPEVIAGSDHYLGDMSADVTCDMHFINAAMAAVNGPDQPLTSLEFECGTGDYGAGADRLLDPSSVDLKTRLCVAQGNRLINYYLLAGGINPPLDEPVGDGNDRISFTGERHGTAAPIDPEGRRGITFDATAGIARATNLHAPWLADMDEEFDDLAVAFLPDAFATEYTHPGSIEMRAVVTDLEQHRGPGQRKALWRSLLFAGYRFSAVNLQDPRATLPSLVCLASGAVLDTYVQQRLVDHLADGRRLLMLGPLPTRDLRGRRCTLLIDALGLEPGRTVRSDHAQYPSVVATDRRLFGLAPSRRFGVTRDDTDLAETRVGWLQEISGGEQVLEGVDGRTCGVLARHRGGHAVVLAAELPSSSLFAGAATTLGVRPGVQLSTSIPGVVGTTTRTPDGQRLVHLLNPTGFAAALDVSGSGVDLRGVVLPARTGVMLAHGLRLPSGDVIRSATAELTAIGPELVFGPSIDPAGHRIVLETTAPVSTEPGAATIERTEGTVIVRSTDPDRPVGVILG